MVEHISPAPTVIQAPTPVVEYLAPVEEYISAVPLVHTAPASVVDFITPSARSLTSVFRCRDTLPGFHWHQESQGDSDKFFVETPSCGLLAGGRGPVRRDDRLGNDAADEAADFGRWRVSPAVIDARRNLSGVCGLWYPVILDLHRFFIAIVRAVVDHDGSDGTAPDPLVWSAGALRKRRRLVHAVRDRAFLPGPPGIWHSE